MADVLIILGHPDTSSLCSELARAYAEATRAMGVTARVLELSTLDFDPILHAGYAHVQELEADLLDARQAITQAKHVVWVYPMWWVGTPALLKGFIDRTFLPGWAFRYDENKALPVKLLKGRSARIIMTMDSPGWWYRLHYRSAATHSFKRGVLSFSGFKPVKTTHIYHVMGATEAQRSAHILAARHTAHRDVRALGLAPLALTPHERLL